MPRAARRRPVSYAVDTDKLAKLPFREWRKYKFFNAVTNQSKRKVSSAMRSYQTYQHPGLPDGPIDLPLRPFMFPGLHVFEPESASAVRQPPMLQHSINHVLDEMELIALEKHAVKDNADVARARTESAAAVKDAMEEARGRASRDGRDAESPVSV